MDPHASSSGAADRPAEAWLRARAAVRRFALLRLPSVDVDALLPPREGEPRGEPLSCSGFEELAERYPALLAGSDRKRSGTWFTPTELVDPTVERVLRPHLGDGAASTLRICDPAVGGGTFLVAALRALRRAGLPARRAALCLHGVDTDCTAAALAAFAVHEACGDDAPELRALGQRIRRGDGLFELPDGGFDAVLTNPPWETLQGPSTVGAAGRELRRRFRHQGGGKLYTYRLFVEQAHRLLRDGGAFGLIVPASLWFDRDARPLRELLLERCEWEWLFGFENRRRLFDIDSRYRFAVVIGRKGGRTRAVRVAFGRVDPGDWAAPRPRHVRYSAELLAKLSPRHRTFVEVEDPRELELLERLGETGRPLCGDGGVFGWRQGDFNMTSHRRLFVLRSDAEAGGYVRGADAVWRGPGPDLLPLYQGAMIYDLHPNVRAHRYGTGHATQWEPARDLEDFRPQYLVDAANWRRDAASRPPARIALRALSNATNERTAVACLLPDVPCGNSLGVLVPNHTEERPLRAMAAGSAVLGSLPFDWVLRRRLTGTNLNGFVLADAVLPRLGEEEEIELARLALSLCAVLPWHEALWDRAREEGWWDGPRDPIAGGSRRAAALTELDWRAGRAYGLGVEDLAWIAADPGPRGFWRIDRDLPAERRRPARWLRLARDMCRSS